MAIPTSRNTLRLFARHTLAYKSKVYALLFGVPIAQIADDFIGPYLMSRILTILAASQASGTQLHLEQFLPYIIGIVAAELFMLVAWHVIVRILWRLEEQTMRDLAMTSFSHLMTMSQRFFNNRFGGSLVSQVNKFIGAYERLADLLVWNIYKLIIAFVCTAVILIRPAPMYVAALFLLAAVYIYAVYRVKKKELPLNEAWSGLETRRTGQLADSITNVAAVKAFAHEKLETELFRERAHGVHDISLKTMRATLTHELATNSIQRLINFTAIGVSLWLAINGTIHVGLVYLILIYTMGLLGRLWDLNRTFRDINRVFGDARDMTQILGMTPDVRDADTTEPCIIHRGDITFQGVYFRHGDKGAHIFKGLDLHIKPGEKIGLVGPSGSGKTTLTQLVLRLMEIQKGQIAIDGQNIAAISQYDLRAHIAYVPQESLLFHRSIRENIRYGRLDASDKEVVVAAKMAHAHEFIKSLPHGYDTLVGERGTKLSGGQRQRIAIARAIVKNAPILILDEATSALDSESEVLIQDALWKLMQGRTTIVVAHRLSTIQKMDRILVLEKGTIVEQGTHRELLRNTGVYAKLWSHQSGGFIK
jgi:ATP-binding cassette, subfamily B, bacterial